MGMMGFDQGSAAACVFRHRENIIAVSVHGDDLTAARPKSSLEWPEPAMKARYKLTIEGRLRPGPSDSREVSVFMSNRTMDAHGD